MWLLFRSLLTKHSVLCFGMLVKCGLDEDTREIAQVFVPVSNRGVLWMLV